jgi:predicted RNase H-like HicB family nuclease
MSHVFTAYIEFDPDTKLYVGSIPWLPGAHSQGSTLDELRTNLQEVVELIVEEQRGQREFPQIEPFVGIQQIAIEI